MLLPNCITAVERKSDYPYTIIRIAFNYRTQLGGSRLLSVFLPLEPITI